MGGKAKGAKAEKMKRAERDARRAVIETALAMSRSGLSPGPLRQRLVPLEEAAC